MHAHLRLAANAATVRRPRAPEPLLPPSRTLFALVDADGGSETEITDEMVREALDALDCEAVTPYRDGARPVASAVEASPARRSAEIIPFPGRRR